MATILLVDDRETTRNTFATCLRLNGFATSTAPTGTAALLAAADRHFDTILVDLKVPDVPGTEVVRELKRRGCRVPVVIYTMFPELDTAFDAGRAGADGYV
jgi:DNA-binding response OmpR family regulator